MEARDDLRERLSIAIAPYRQQLVTFVDDGMSPGDFERAYFDIYLHDDSTLEDDVLAVVDGFFSDVDAMVVDPGLRPHVRGAIGPDELRDRARDLLQKSGYDVQAAHPA